MKQYTYGSVSKRVRSVTRLLVVLLAMLLLVGINTGNKTMLGVALVILIALILFKLMLYIKSKKDYLKSVASQQIRADIQRGAGIEPDSGEGKVRIPAWDEIPQEIRDAAGDNKVLAIKLLRERGAAKREN